MAIWLRLALKTPFHFEDLSHFRFELRFKYFVTLSFHFQNPIPKIQYYIDHRNQREAQILDVLKSNADTWYTNLDLVKIIYVETPEQLWRAAAQNVLRHLKKLEKEQKVESKQIDLHNEQSSIKWKYMKN